jgi:hypothetical protein
LQRVLNPQLPVMAARSNQDVRIAQRKRKEKELVVSLKHRLTSAAFCWCFLFHYQRQHRESMEWPTREAEADYRRAVDLLKWPNRANGLDGLLLLRSLAVAGRHPAASWTLRACRRFPRYLFFKIY